MLPRSRLPLPPCLLALLKGKKKRKGAELETAWRRFKIGPFFWLRTVNKGLNTQLFFFMELQHREAASPESGDERRTSRRRIRKTNRSLFFFTASARAKQNTGSQPILVIDACMTQSEAQPSAASPCGERWRHLFLAVAWVQPQA